MIAITSRLRRAEPVEPNGPMAPQPVADELSALGDAVADEIGVLLTEATTVREFLSVTTGRVLAHLAELRATLRSHGTVADDLDAVLADLFAIAGLWQESTVRGPAWRIGDTGRRLERCAVLLDMIAGVLEHAPDPTGTEVDASVIEVLLASNDSLVAYRRRHRSEVDPDLALRLLVDDRSNPRSLAASIDRLELHAVDGEAALTEHFVEPARAALELPVDEMVPALRSLVVDAGRLIVGRWFSTPVNPIPFTPNERGVG